MPDQIRSFVAIELPDTVKAGLKKIQDRFKAIDPSCAKWVDPYGIHLTLKFLGNVDVEKIDAIDRIIEEASQSTNPFRLEIKGLGAFPNLRRVQVIWVGVSGDLETLQKLQKSLEFGLGRLGFPPEGRAFTPHLTLARLRENATPLQRQSLGETIAHLKLESDLIIDVNTLSLMRSQLARTGAIYTQLYAAKLRGTK